MLTTSPQQMQHKSPISLNVPDELRDAIDEAARAKLLSRSAWIRTTLADHVAEELSDRKRDQPQD